jgi:two-component system response regulator HydG
VERVAEESTPVRVLMVDDNKEHVALCAEYLPKEDFHLDAAYSATEALEMLSKHEYDILVLDYALPDMNGIDLLKKIKPMSLKIPMIFVSAYDDPDLSFEAMRAGACDYVVKTFQYYETLKDRIVENLETCPTR